MKTCYVSENAIKLLGENGIVLHQKIPIERKELRSWCKHYNLFLEKDVLWILQTQDESSRKIICHRYALKT